MNFEAATVFVPKTISNILREVSMIDDFSMKSSRLDFYVHLLQEEMRKIDAFKRELPQCMFLIKHAIEQLKEESLKWKEKQMESVMKEFMPLKKNNDSYENGRAKRSDDSSEKKNWLSSVQLWSTTIQYENQDSGSVKYQQGEKSGIGSQGQGSNFQSRGGAFVPFKKPNVGIEMEEKKASAPIEKPVDGLSLSIPVDDVEEIDLKVKKDNCGIVRPQLQELYNQQLHKKQRRCWSPELHKLFVDALHQLGGHKSATPKMIRELMKVDGLTNDEVKSHLQKYRLHIKKIPSSLADPNKFPWLNKNQCGDINKAKAGSSGSPQGPFQIGPGPIKVGSGTAGESMDEDEDEDDRFESHSWMRRILRSSEKTSLGLLQ